MPNPKPPLTDDVVRFLMASRLTPGYGDFMKFVSAEAEYYTQLVSTIRGDADARAHGAGMLSMLREIRSLFTDPKP
jgi:hypothetical protein